MESTSAYALTATAAGSHADGTGNVILGHESEVNDEGELVTRDVGFFGLRDAARVRRLVREPTRSQSPDDSGT